MVTGFDIYLYIKVYVCTWLHFNQVSISYLSTLTMLKNVHVRYSICLKYTLDRLKTSCDCVPGDSWRIVMIGQTGVGKSATGNTILGEDRFESHPSAGSDTKTCQKEETQWNNRLINVADTPGILDTDKTEELIKREIVRCVKVSIPGPHVFLLVIQAGRFTKEERNSVQALQELFGPEAKQFMIVLFSHGGCLDSTIQDYLREGDSELQRLIQECGNRFHVFENTSRDRNQVDELFRKINDMVAVNGGRFYTDAMYQEVEAARRAARPNVDENQYSFIGDLMQRIRRFINILQRD